MNYKKLFIFSFLLSSVLFADESKNISNTEATVRTVWGSVAGIAGTSLAKLTILLAHSNDRDVKTAALFFGAVTAFLLWQAKQQNNTLIANNRTKEATVLKAFTFVSAFYNAKNLLKTIQALRAIHYSNPHSSRFDIIDIAKSGLLKK